MTKTTKNWVELLADLLSGRVFNSLLSLNDKMRQIKGRLNLQEIRMTHNEEVIATAAGNINTAVGQIREGVQNLKDRLDALDVPQEDLSEELAQLEAAVGGLGSVASDLTAAPASNTGGTSGPIVHGENTPTPLAGSSGPTDAGAPTEVPQPGTSVPSDDPAPEEAPADEAPAPSEEEAPASTEDEAPPTETHPFDPANPVEPVPFEGGPDIVDNDTDEPEDEDTDNDGFDG